MTYKDRSSLLAAYTATQNIVPQIEHEIKVSMKIYVLCALLPLGYITLGQAPPSLMLILAARETQYITPLKCSIRLRVSSRHQGHCSCLWWCDSTVKILARPLFQAGCLLQNWFGLFFNVAVYYRAIDRNYTCV